MTVNTLVLSGQIRKVDLNTKPTKKGPAAVILVQYGKSREPTQQAVQFLNVALVRIPPFVYEKCKDTLKEGALVDIVGHVQGVLKHIMAEGFVVNELVADRVQVLSDEEDEVEGEDEVVPAA